MGVNDVAVMEFFDALAKGWPMLLALPDAPRAVHGVVSERSNEHAWKACNGESHSRVRISPSPPLLRAIFLFFLNHFAGSMHRLSYCRLDRL